MNDKQKKLSTWQQQRAAVLAERKKNAEKAKTPVKTTPVAKEEVEVPATVEVPKDSGKTKSPSKAAKSAE